jgi:hypothetical protein
MTETDLNAIPSQLHQMHILEEEKAVKSETPLRGWGVSTTAHLQSHVHTSRLSPANVREGMGEIAVSSVLANASSIVIVAQDCPLKSLLKIRKSGLFGHFIAD